MEIKINIPKNEYVQPTEVREEVVQGICESFLHGCSCSVFHPFSEGCYRRAGKYIVRHKGNKHFYGFLDKPYEWEEGVVFNGEEMKAAFNALQEAGYYMFRIYEYRSWMGYKCGKNHSWKMGRE